MQLLGNLFEYELARRGETLNVLGATSGDTGSAAEYALRGKRGIQVFMLSPHGRMSPFQQAQMFSLQDANIHNIAIEGVFDDCQDIVKAVSNDLAFKRRWRIGTVNSINWARLLAQVVYYFAGYLQATPARGAGRRPLPTVSFAVPSGNFGNICAGHVARMMGLPIRRSRAGDEREQRARRVLSHRHLPRAPRRRDARDVESVDGHLEGVELRALRRRSGRPRSRAREGAVRGRRRPQGRLHADGGRVRSRRRLRLRLRDEHPRRPRRDDCRHAPAFRDGDRHPHSRRPEGRARPHSNPASR